MTSRPIRERRGRLAILIAGAFILSTGLAALLGWARVAYSLESLLVLTIVLLFGVGVWSRYLPQDESDQQVPAPTTSESPGEKPASGKNDEGGQNDVATT